MTTLYGLTTCDTCKKARRWLDEAGIAHTFIDLRANPPAIQTLHVWAAQRGGAAALVNRASTTWRQLPEARKHPAHEAEWMTLLQEFSALIRRPLLVMPGGRIHQGFNAAHYQTLFGASA